MVAMGDAPLSRQPHPHWRRYREVLVRITKLSYVQMEIIDCERKGNLIRFYLGKNGKQWGDDWDDAPYEHNAGRVYDEFIEDHEDLAVPFDWEVEQPGDRYNNSPYTKKDMVQRKVPCLTFFKPDGSKRPVYFGDSVPNL